MMVFFLGDFFQLLFACCQENVFSMERFKRLTEQASSGSAFNSNRRGSRGKTVTPDFMWNITWLDFVKVDFVNIGENQQLTFSFVTNSVLRSISQRNTTIFRVFGNSSYFIFIQWLTDNISRNVLRPTLSCKETLIIHPSYPYPSPFGTFGSPTQDITSIKPRLSLQKVTGNFIVAGVRISTHVLGDFSRSIHHCSKHHQHLQFWFYFVVFLLLVARPSALPSAEDKTIQTLENLHRIQLFHAFG